MIRSSIRIIPSVSLFSVFMDDENPHDVVKTDKTNIFTPDPHETGLQRLQNLFKPYQDHPIHPKLITLYQTSLTTFVMGGIYGGIIESRKAFINFIETNEASKFLNHFQAKRQLSDKMFTSFMKGLVKMGARISIFCSTFVFTYTLLSVYCNRSSFWHYSVAGLCTGSLHKFSLGPRGMVAGGFFGCFFGSLYGGLKVLMLTLVNMSDEELREKLFQLHIEREEAIAVNKKKILMNDTEKELKNVMLDPK